MKTGYPYGFQGLHCIEKRSDTPASFINNHNNGQTKELENSLVLCVGIVLFILFTCKIRPKLLTRLPLPPLPPPMPHPTFQTHPQFLLLLHLVQWHLLWSMLIKLLYALSPPLHHSVFLLLHSLFPMTNSELASISIDCSIRCQYPVHIQPTKSLPVLKLICWLVLFTNYTLISSYGQYFCPVFSFHFCFLLLILCLSL